MLAKLLYKPFGIVLGILAGSLAGRVFDSIWRRVDADHEPPGARTEDASTRQVLAARGIQAATTAVTLAAVDRAGARAFRHVTGFWPGARDKTPRAS